MMIVGDGRRVRRPMSALRLYWGPTLYGNDNRRIRGEYMWAMGYVEKWCNIGAKSARWIYMDQFGLLTNYSIAAFDPFCSLRWTE